MLIEVSIGTHTNCIVFNNQGSTNWLLWPLKLELVICFFFSDGWRSVSGIISCLIIYPGVVKIWMALLRRHWISACKNLILLMQFFIPVIRINLLIVVLIFYHGILLLLLLHHQVLIYLIFVILLDFLKIFTHSSEIENAWAKATSGTHNCHYKNPKTTLFSTYSTWSVLRCFTAVAFICERNCKVTLLFEGKVLSETPGNASWVSITWIR